MPNNPFSQSLDNLEYGLDLTDVSIAEGSIDAQGQFMSPMSGGFSSPTVQNWSHLGDMPGFETLFAQYGTQGKQAYSLLQDYDPMREGISRRGAERDIEDALDNITAISQGTFNQRRGIDQIIGKTGFAGSGAADKNISFIQDEYSTDVNREKSNMQGAILAHRMDVNKERQKYVDELWSSYNEFLLSDPDTNLEFGIDPIATFG